MHYKTLNQQKRKTVQARPSPPKAFQMHPRDRQKMHSSSSTRLTNKCPSGHASSCRTGSPKLSCASKLGVGLGPSRLSSTSRRGGTIRDCCSMLHGVNGKAGRLHSSCQLVKHCPMFAVHTEQPAEAQPPVVLLKFCGPYPCPWTPVG